MDSILLTLINEAWTHPWLDALMIALTTAGLVVLGLLPVAIWQRGPRRLAWSLLAAQGAALVGVLIFY